MGALLGIHLPPADAGKLATPYTLEDIARALIVRMREVQADGPYYVAGWCVNGVIAYEIARQLTAQGHEVALLGLFDAQNPAFYQDFSQEGRLRLLWKRAQTQFANLKRQKLSEFAGERLIGIRRHLSVGYWRLHNAFHLRVNEKGLEDLDTIVDPASFDYRPWPVSRWGQGRVLPIDGLAGRKVLALSCQLGWPDPERNGSVQDSGRARIHVLRGECGHPGRQTEACLAEAIRLEPDAVA